MANETKIVTVIGATGALGTKIVRSVIQEGGRVRAMVRASSDRSRLQALGVTDFVVGDLLDRASLDLALQQKPLADAVIASAAGYTGHTKGDSTRADTEGYRNLVDATKAAKIPRFVLISILESDKATEVPHFYHKFLTEQHLEQIGQPFVALRAGAFLDQSQDMVSPMLGKGKYPAFFPKASLGMIYTPDLARYAAMAAIKVPDSVLGSRIDVGWSRAVSGSDLAKAFSNVLGRPIKAVPAFPPLVTNVVLPLLGIFQPGLRDIVAMIRWVNKGGYFSRNTTTQKELFGDLPEPEEAVRRFCKDFKLIP